MKIAVIGGGISGLTAAFHLAPAHETWLFERDGRLGGHAHTHEVVRHGRRWPVDTGFMVFNTRTYPHFVRLLDTLGVGSRPTDMSFSVRCRRCGLEYSSAGLAGLFADRRLLRSTEHLGLLLDVLRFFRAARRALADGTAAALTLGQFLDAHRFGDGLRRHFVLPMGGAIWSAAAGAIEAFPAASYLRFLDNHGLLAATGQPVWRTIEGGSRVYVERIRERLRERVVVGRAVTGITRSAHAVTIDLQGGPAVTADAVVIATHADDALALLADPDDDERAALGAFRYSTNRAVLHDDLRQLPDRPAARASWNVALDDCRDDVAPVTVTYDLARLQGLEGAGPLLCTLNGSRPAGAPLACMRYTHPILDHAALAAQAAVAALNGRRRTWYCGAHLRYGFHEDGVQSALAVVRGLGVPA
ncbi:MAG: NAD(P)/FAD-dependent oxidoreductase [Vicinamibacterales bacterium]